MARHTRRPAGRAERTGLGSLDPTSWCDAFSSCTRRVGHHCKEVRWRAGGSPLESGIPRGERLGHGLPGFMQPCQLVIHLLQETLAGCADRMTRWATAVARFQKARQFLRREAEANGVSDEQEARNGIVRIVAKTASRPRYPRQDTNAFVVAHQIRADASTTRSLTDSEGSSRHTPSYSLESFQIQNEVLTYLVSGFLSYGQFST